MLLEEVIIGGAFFPPFLGLRRINIIAINIAGTRMNSIV